jgi:hypothetical protein
MKNVSDQAVKIANAIETMLRNTTSLGTPLPDFQVELLTKLLSVRNRRPTNRVESGISGNNVSSSSHAIG